MAHEDEVKQLKLYFTVKNGVLCKFRYGLEAYTPCGTVYKTATGRTEMKTVHGGKVYPNHVLAYIVQYEQIPRAVRCLDGDYTNLKRENLIEVAKHARTPKDFKTPGVHYTTKTGLYRAFVRLAGAEGKYTIGRYRDSKAAAFAATHGQQLADTLEAAEGFAPDEIAERLRYFCIYLRSLEEHPGDERYLATFQAKFQRLCETPHGGKKEFDLFY